MAGPLVKPVRTGWSSVLACGTTLALVFLGATGLAVTFVPFHASVEWGVVVHTVVGLLTLAPVAWYLWAHWRDYRSYRFSHVVLLGYVATAALIVCLVSGVVVTAQGLVAPRMSPVWRQVHLLSTFVTLGAALPHMALVLFRLRAETGLAAALRLVGLACGLAVLGLALTGLLPLAYPGPRYANEFPADYEYLYGAERPFAPSLARTASGGAYDARSLAGSETCGSPGCHTQIVEEWKPSAHRYAAMDPAFQKIQTIMAAQNGSESTRYCGGCHDPISLFSGTKNIGVEKLTNLHGYREGISCLACHAIRETDIRGNANYTMTQPAEYLWQWAESGWRRAARDFLIRTYPAEHNRLSKRMFKAPEYCAACHKQFIDEEVNRVGWVQLQNQYDNWAASHWNHKKDDPSQTVECRECHMPLVASNDPAAGDAADANRRDDDGMHRSHRFIGANAMMPAVLRLEGWERQVELTERWLRGAIEIPEIRHKWATGPIVRLALEAPQRVAPGDKIPIRVVLTSNKVGHDFPTGPLDIIQSWVEIEVRDDRGQIVYSSGKRDERNFIEPGSFLFKVEPVDQYGNLIDRHNLWEMVGVRFRRALFPGYSDAVDYLVGCPDALRLAPPAGAGSRDASVGVHDVAAAPGTTRLHVLAKLNYRKVDQFLLNYMFGADSGLSAPVVELDRAEAEIAVEPPRIASSAPLPSFRTGS